MRYLAPVFLLASFLYACDDAASSKQPEPMLAVVSDSGNIKKSTYPEERKEVNKQAVASYKEKVDNPLNEWYFSVQLFETSKSFHYKMILQYEEIRGVDTLKLPNFGLEPKPEIRKGADAFSCIVGFLDKEGNFREYKKVYVANGGLKVTTIKHYGVSTIKRELE